MKILTLKEAASLLRMHPEMLRRMAKAGKIHHRRVGMGQKSPRYKFLLSTIEKIMNSELPFQDPRTIQHKPQRKYSGDATQNKTKPVEDNKVQQEAKGAV